jgi:hypothetical protein
MCGECCDGVSAKVRVAIGKAVSKGRIYQSLAE